MLSQGRRGHLYPLPEAASPLHWNCPSVEEIPLQSPDSEFFRFCALDDQFSILSATVGVSLGPESLWADHLLQQGKILGQCTVHSSFTWGTSYSSTVNLPSNVIYFSC